MDKPQPSNPELELAICREPDKNETWQVYSDWLQTQGYPLGEVIAMELACLGDDSRETELRPRIKETYPDWGKDLYRETDWQGRVSNIKFGEEKESEISMVWNKGCVETITLVLNLHEPLDTLYEILETILNSNYSRLLSGLSFMFWALPPEYMLEENDQFLQPSKSISVLFAEILTIFSETSAGMSLLQLRLESLGDGAQSNLFRPYFQNDSLPALTQLELSVNGYESDILAELLSSPFLPGLKKLKITGKFESDDSVQPLLDQADSFQHLEELGVSGADIDHELTAKLQNVFGEKILFLED